MVTPQADVHRIPSYAELPRVGSARQRSGWGVFGEHDVFGRVNLIGPDQVRRASALVRSGSVFPLNWDVALPEPPILNRGRVTHRVVRVTDGWDDYLDDFYPQASTQWDALCHCRHPELGYYNGHRSPDEFDGGSTVRDKLGMHTLAARGIATRFVLLDLADDLHRGTAAERPDPPVGVDLLDAAVRREGVQLEPGDAVLVRTGWIRDYLTMGTEQRSALGAGPVYAPGLENSEDVLGWLWDHGVSIIASDTPSLERAPFDVERLDGFLHYQLIPLLGFLIGEMLQLDALAKACAEQRRWTGLLTAAPLNVHGGVGSPGNALALL